MDAKKASADYYFKFNEETQHIRATIDALGNTAADAHWTADVDQLLHRLKSLEQSLNQASIFLPPYDLKTYVQVGIIRGFI